MKNWNWKFIWLTFTAVVIIGSLWIWNYNSFNDKYGDPDGSFGDKFGVVNALFSGLAFAGIIITIYLQMSELREQRDELKMTRGTFEKQLFESTFFEMLKIHNENVQSMGDDKVQGRKAIQGQFKILIQLKSELGISSPVTITGKLLNEFPLEERVRFMYVVYYLGKSRGEHVWKNRYKGFPIDGQFTILLRTEHSGVEVVMSAYYRHIFQLVKYVHDAPDDIFLPFEAKTEKSDSKKWTNEMKTDHIKKEKYRYVKFLRSQLSIEQQQLFALNALSEFGKEWKNYNGVNLIEEYQLIKNLHEDDLNVFGVSLKKEFPGVWFYE